MKVLLQRYTQPISSYSDVLQTTAGAMLDAIDLTEGSNRQKAGDINISWILLLLGLVLAFILLGLITLVSQMASSSIIIPITLVRDVLGWKILERRARLAEN